MIHHRLHVHFLAIGKLSWSCELYGGSSSSRNSIPKTVSKKQKGDFDDCDEHHNDHSKSSDGIGKSKEQS